MEISMALSFGISWKKMLKQKFTAIFCMLIPLVRMWIALFYSLKFSSKVRLRSSSSVYKDEN